MDSRQHGCGLLLDVGPYRREIRRDRDRADALALNVVRSFLERIDVERRVFLAVVERAAADKVALALHDRHQVVRPRDHRRDAVGLRQRDAHRGDPRQVLALYECVDELGRADHDAAKVLRPDTRLRKHRIHGVHDAVANLRGRELLGRRDDLVADHRHRVGVRSADVDPQPWGCLVHWAASAVRT